MGGMPRKPGAEFEAYMVGGKIYPWTASTGRWWTYLAWWVIPLAFPVSVALFNRFGVRNKGLEIGGYGVAGLYVLVSGILWLVL
jgi:hypothetical protein